MTLAKEYASLNVSTLVLSFPGPSRREAISGWWGAVEKVGRYLRIEDKWGMTLLEAKHYSAWLLAIHKLEDVVLLQAYLSFAPFWVSYPPPYGVRARHYTHLYLFSSSPLSGVEGMEALTFPFPLPRDMARARERVRAPLLVEGASLLLPTPWEGKRVRSSADSY